MASYHGNSPSEPAKMEQIIPEFFAKSLHIIIESRCSYASSRDYSGDLSISSPCSSLSSSSSIRPRDKQFNLALRDCPAALENMEFWGQSNLESMTIDVILGQRRNEWDPDEFGFETKSEKIIERWVVQYGSRNSGRRLNSTTLCKKLILLLRSLYVTVRLLPAYKLFRELNSSGQIQTFHLGHRVSSFVEPFTRKEEAEMQQFVFTPVDTSCGRLCISVFYKSSLADANSESSSAMPPQLIPDYVGSPMADPLKRFPSIPVPQYSPSSSSPFGRRHSWSYDQYRASPPSAFPSPSPTFSESRFSVPKPGSHGLPPMSLPRRLAEMPQDRTGNTSFDGYWPSPTFSPSSSPSQAGYIPGRHISKTLIRSESAPLSIPASKIADTPFLSPKQNFPPSPLKARPSISVPDRSSGLIQTGPTVEKLFTGRLSGARISSNSSVQKSFSRNSSRLSYQDDYDDSVFCGPFVLDDNELTEPRTRPGSYDQTGHPWDPHDPEGVFRVRKTQDAGALHYMLKKAPPLHQHLTESRNLLVNPNQIPEQPGYQITADSLTMGSSLILVSKTTTDALEELRGYREMKDLLLRQGGRSGI